MDRSQTVTPLETGAKQDERALWIIMKLIRQTQSSNVLDARAVAELILMPRKRMEYILAKWARRGLYDWGVVIDRGWFVAS